MEDSSPEHLDPPPVWPHNWQLPALLLGCAALALGLWIALPSPEKQDYAGLLDSVSQYLTAQNLDKAEELLKAHAEEMKQAPDAHRARYYLLWGDLIYLQQEFAGWRKPENYETIIKLYDQSRELGQNLDTEHLKRFALTLVALGRHDEAMEMLKTMKADNAEARYLIVRAIVETQLTNPDVAADDVTPLLAQFFDEVQREPDPAKQRAQQLWGVDLQAKLWLDSGDPQRVIDYLNMRLIRLQDSGSDRDLAPLYVQLGNAYSALSRYDDADRLYRFAQQRLKQEDALNADILVGQARIMIAQSGKLQEALELYSAAQTSYQGTAAYLDALIGRADCEARLGAHAQAVDHFAQAVKHLVEQPRRKTSQVDALTATVRANYEMNFARGESDLALSYLSTLMPLFGRTLPAQLLVDLAVTHEKIGEQRMARAQSIVPAEASTGTGATNAGDDVAPTAASRKLAFQEAAIHFGNAAKYYEDYAAAVTVSDDEAHGNSLWRAAQNYDKAHMWQRAIDAYGLFVRSRPSDPRNLAAINHLAMAYMADGQYATAGELFKELVEQHPKHAAAHMSLVPLARCHVALGEYDQAQRVLEHVINDHPAITPEARSYRDALIELGKLYYQREDYPRAVETLELAVERYGESEGAAALKFRLADAYRQSVESLSKSMDDPLPQSKRLAIQQDRAKRLERAMVLFSQVISSLEAAPEDAGEPLDRMFHRNAYFYRGDCAYDLGRYEQAIMLYDLAAKRWEDHPASLVALVQIVNSYCEMGRMQEARVANDRARWQLKRIPDDAFNDPNLPMDRQHWENWLRWTNELNLYASNTGKQR